MLRVLIIFVVFFGVLANAAHGVAHASGHHRHDVIEASEHAHDHEEASEHDGPDADESRSTTPDHAVGHTHVVGDRSSTLDVVARGYASSGTSYRIRADMILPSTPSAPLLEPPSA